MTKINSLLIANRGEIAIRISETAKKMGIKTYGIK
ncbi:MAG: biotin carboxylase N-terminal domain-containing protein, partial [Bacteroidales bacterium]